MDNSRKEDGSFLSGFTNSNKHGLHEWNPSKQLRLPKSQLSLYNEGKRFDYVQESSDKVAVTFSLFDSVIPSNLENRVFHEEEACERDSDINSEGWHMEGLEYLLASMSNMPEAMENGSRKESSLDKVCGLTEAKNTLRNVFIYRILYPQFFPGNIQWNRVLLYGPPGTGKSLLAKAMAEEINAVLYKVSSADLLSQWHGETEKHIRTLFEEARSCDSPVVLFFDEVDGLCRRRSSSESDLVRRIKTELLMQFENEESQDQQHNQMYLIGATNCPWDIDPAFLRRFHRKIYIPLPDRGARIDILKQGFGDIETSLTGDEWEEVGRMTEGYSGSDLANVVMSSCSERLHSVMNCHFWKLNGDIWTPTAPDSKFSVRIDFQELPSHQVRFRSVNFGDVESGIAKTPKTVSREELNKFEKYSAGFS